jgi:hypothetical protein
MAPENLPPSASVVNTNAKLIGGDLDAWKSPQLVSGVTLGSGTIRTLYRFGQNLNSNTQYWFQFSTPVSVVRGPVVSDTEERTYWTDGVYPKKTKSNLAQVSVPYPTSSLRLGVPRPDFTLAVSVSGTASSSTSQPITSLYQITYVTSWGEESAPCLASAPVTWQQGQTITVTLPGNVRWVDDSGTHTTGGPYDITMVRIYRTASGTNSTAFLYRADVAVSATTFTDTALDSTLGNQIYTTLWDPPPDNMIGLTVMGNGIMAGFFDSTLCFCETGVPYAWPGAYRLSMPSKIVSIAAYDNTLVVGTTRGIHLVTGVDPSAMTAAALNQGESCVSFRSMVPMLGGVVWASPNGLWFVNAAGAVNLVKDVFQHDEWQAYNPSSFEAYDLDGRYIASYALTNGTTGTLIVQPGNPPVVMTTNQTFTAAYHEKAVDILFVVQGSNLYAWDSGYPLTYTWRSKTFRCPSWQPMGWGKVQADSYPVTFRLIADGVQRGADISVPSNAAFPLPAGRAYNYAFEISAAYRVTAAGIASTPEELSEI